jgi:hypothetical protein
VTSPPAIAICGAVLHFSVSGRPGHEVVGNLPELSPIETVWGAAFGLDLPPARFVFCQVDVGFFN